MKVVVDALGGDNAPNEIVKGAIDAQKKYKDLGIKKDEVKVSKKEIDEEIARLASRFAEIVVKENGDVLEGNTAVIDFKGYVDGKELEGGNGENYPLEIGSHTFIPGFEEGIVGMKVGET